VSASHPGLVGAARLSSTESRLAYPRPQFRRRAWQTLDGTWSFAVSGVRDGRDVEWNQEIVVPFPPESKLSGLELAGELPVVWYRRAFRVPDEWRGQRMMLHFGAVDYRAEVWLNGHRAGSHEGGHTPFSFDVTELLVEGEQEILVRAEDPPAAFDQPRGKQDWRGEAHSIWYPRTTGIWQTVWLEPLPPSHVASLRVTPDVARFSLALDIDCSLTEEGLDLEVAVSVSGRQLVRDRISLLEANVRRTMHLPDPGIDDARAELLWSPERPTLLDIELTLLDGDEVVDSVESYAGLRSVEARAGRFYLNGRPYFQRLVLDQGYWPDGLVTAAGPEALLADVQLAKAMGFNGVRKHQKLEDPRYHYCADRLGLLVWNELPSAYSFGPRASQRLVRTWLEAIERDFNHPCVVAWVPFNESWGVPELPGDRQQRDLVAGLYRLTKSLDPTRIVIDNDGWEHGESDLFTVHDYSHEPEAIEARYGSRERLRSHGLRYRPGGRELALEPGAAPEAVLVSEFGGVRFAGEGAGWGYSEVHSAANLLERVAGLVAALQGSDAVIGFCYTQFADTFQEQNGLLFADRRPKASLPSLAEAIGKGGVD
jgi:beta-galactosidase/beta-glucuronidase